MPIIFLEYAQSLKKAKKNLIWLTYLTILQHFNLIG